MNPDEVEDQISEMFRSVPINLLNTIEGFIIILHGSNGCSINMSNEILNTSLDEKKVIVASLLRKITDNPQELIGLLDLEGAL